MLSSTVRDDLQQVEVARVLLEALTAERQGYVCREAVVELVRVLERAYHFSRARVATVLEQHLAREGLVFEVADDVAQAAFRYRTGGEGFSDLMILAAARRSNAHPVYTFDQRPSRLEGVTLLGSHRT